VIVKDHKSLATPLEECYGWKRKW